MIARTTPPTVNPSELASCFFSSLVGFLIFFLKLARCVATTFLDQLINYCWNLLVSWPRILFILICYWIDVSSSLSFLSCFIWNMTYFSSFILIDSFKQNMSRLDFFLTRFNFRFCRPLNFLILVERVSSDFLHILKSFLYLAKLTWARATHSVLTFFGVHNRRESPRKGWPELALTTFFISLFDELYNWKNIHL